MTARCRHFTVCGGCQAQDVPYAEQVRRKGEMLEALFLPYWRRPIAVTPSPAVWHYRNKVDPSFAPKRYDEPPASGFQRETVLGFKQQGRWFWPMDIDECLIGPEGLGPLLASVRAWARKSGLRAYDTKTHEGFLRNLLVREGKRTGERMVVLITTPGPLDAQGFLGAVRAAWPAQSVYRGLNTGFADVAVASELELLDGAPFIHENLLTPDGVGVRALKFRISPFSFFQTNSLATEQLYGWVRTWVKGLRPRALYDLYGGAGGIALSCADLVERVCSVEIVPEASVDGRANATTNGVDNVTFVTAKVKNYLKDQIAVGGLDDSSAVIVDPARSGLEPKALRRLLELRPPHLLYVSCNPKVLAAEMEMLLAAYALDDLHAFDLFPHTRHVEVVASLRLGDV